MDGVLVIDKPAGPTSHDVVAEVRRALRIRKVGHTGTLDPAATGALPLVLGKATKIARFLSGSDKGYVATIRLGINTTTLDAEGVVTKERPVDTSNDAIHAAIDTFRGSIEQLPPMYSAKRVDGKRLYELAREGQEIEREAKVVTIHALDVLEINLPDIVVDVRCSAGTYIRTLAEDLGEALGCGGHLLNLRRTIAGPFNVTDAVALDALVDNPDLAKEKLLNLSQALSGLPRVEMPRSLAHMITQGYQLTVADLRTLDLPKFHSDAAVALAPDGGDVMAVASALIDSDALDQHRRDSRALKTERVLARGGN